MENYNIKILGKRNFLIIKNKEGLKKDIKYLKNSTEFKWEEKAIFSLLNKIEKRNGLNFIKLNQNEMKFINS